VLTAEILLVLTILVIGLIAGLVALRQAFLTELGDIANAFLTLNQSYSFAGQSNCVSSTAGSFQFDFCDSIVTRRTDANCFGFNELACD
jgi:hypothetical protein